MFAGVALARTLPRTCTRCNPSLLRRYAAAAASTSAQQWFTGHEEESAKVLEAVCAKVAELNEARAHQGAVGRAKESDRE